MESVEKECGALGGLFQAIVNDMKVPELDSRRQVLQTYCIDDQTQFTAFVSSPVPYSLPPHWLCNRINCDK